ncbi:MAG: PEP/pyruvate-binding domain-containing protein, partial [Candidatus Hodarchaeales archaeon]
MTAELDTPKKDRIILWFREIRNKDVSLVGGKAASLGEMIGELQQTGLKVPDGFAVTVNGYNLFLRGSPGLQESISEEIQQVRTAFLNLQNAKEKISLEPTDREEVIPEAATKKEYEESNRAFQLILEQTGAAIRERITQASLPDALTEEIARAYKALSQEAGLENVSVAVRSSATAEDLPDASFAGQQDTFLNVSGFDKLKDACLHCFASLFTNRAISYREDQHFIQLTLAAKAKEQGDLEQSAYHQRIAEAVDHFNVGLSIAVQLMVRSDLASSGVIFSIDTESGFDQVVYITAAFGLGEFVVQGRVNPDQHWVFKPTMTIADERPGVKDVKLVYSENGVCEEVIPGWERKKFCLTHDEVLKLAEWAIIIEKHYKKAMDIEWAKDGLTNELYIVQARPETVHSTKGTTEIYQLLERPKKSVIEGEAVGNKIGKGTVHIIKDTSRLSEFVPGEVLVTVMTDPDWEPIMKVAAAIVTNRGGRTCFTGDTLLLTNEGFMTFEQVFEDHEGLFVPSLNRSTLKIEWKPIIASMKRKANVIEVNASQTGRVKNNTLKITPDHKILTFEDRKLVSKEISNVLDDNQMALLAQKIPRLSESTEKDRKLAYLLGALSSDGHIYLSRTHGEVQFIQKPTKEKEKFIEAVNTYMEELFDKRFSVQKKKQSSGMIRGKPIVGTANAYRCYSKQVAVQLVQEQQNVVPTILQADEELIFNYLAGFIDGDGSYNHESNRINIYCSNDSLLQSIIVSCLRLGILPQVTTNRSIYNVQIVERIEEILAYTKRVKGIDRRKIFGTRFFSAKQLVGDIIEEVNYNERIRPFVEKNLLIDANKIQEYIIPLCKREEERMELSRVLESDTRMHRISFAKNIGVRDVYNITVEDNNNYIVFTSRLSPILVNNCHAAIVSRELGIPCVIGTEYGTEVLKKDQDVTVDCSEGQGLVYDGLLPFKVSELDLTKIPKTRTKIMLNIGIPEQAFTAAHLPHSGVGLGRVEFIINSHIQIHPLALVQFKDLELIGVQKGMLDYARSTKMQIESLTEFYLDKAEFFVDRLAYGIGRIGAAFYPKPVIIRLSDFKTNEYANLIGGKLFEPEESNPMIGWRGCSRYYDKRFEAGFILECRALAKVRNDMKLHNVVVMLPFCRTPAEAELVRDIMKEHGLVQGEPKDSPLQLYCMAEIPSNVILADKFSNIVDG